MILLCQMLKNEDYDGPQEENFGCRENFSIYLETKYFEQNRIRLIQYDFTYLQLILHQSVVVMVDNFHF